MSIKSQNVIQNWRDANLIPYFNFPHFNHYNDENII